MLMGSPGAGPGPAGAGAAWDACGPWGDWKDRGRGGGGALLNVSECGSNGQGVHRACGKVL
jgi:hypothetical protein